MKKITKILSVILAAVMLMTMLCVTSSADSIEDTAKAIDSGSKVSFKPTGEWKDFKVTLSEKGTLRLNITTKSKYSLLKVLDSNGKSVKPTSEDIATGYTGYSSLNGWNELHWNSSLEKFSGKILYESLSKGTYYVRLGNYTSWYSFYPVNGKMSVSFKYPQAATNEEETGTISSLSVTLKKGETLQLGAVIEGEGTPKWTTSKKSVATVDSSGKITAKSAGTANIKATLGKSTVKIQVKVTKK